jgi:hypothetical protein
MNQQHGRYPIPNDEYLYTLSTFIYEPIRWNDRFGWRKLMTSEKLAHYFFWREIGKRMNIKDIPDSYEAFEAYNMAYEREQLKYSPGNQALAEVTRNLMLSWVLPKPLWPVGAPFIHALIDDALLRAVGLPIPPNWMRRMVETMLKLRGQALRVLPRRRAPRLLTQMKSRTYPKGYTSIEQLGADR